MTAERRAHGAQNALEETKTMLEQADRSRRQAEQDLADSHENLADLTVQNQGFVSAKRKLESDLADLRGEADEAKGEASMADERAKKFMMDAASLAEELRSEQEQAQALERDRREQEAKTKDLQVQLDDAETNAIKWGGEMVQLSWRVECRVLHSGACHNTLCPSCHTRPRPPARTSCAQSPGPRLQHSGPGPHCPQVRDQYLVWVSIKISHFSGKI